jgi:signal transduction histidine kinase
MLTVGITFSFYRSAKNKDSLRFNSEVSRIQTAFESRLNLYISLLKGGRGFVETVGELNRNNFAAYVKNLEIDKNYSGIQGIGYSKVVLPSERENLIRQMKSEGYSDFKMFPEGERDIYQSIIYLEPLNERNQAAIGFDMSTEENRRQALDRARDSGAEAATAKIELLQEITPDIQAGFLIYSPVYKKGTFPATVDERRANLEGYVYSPFRAGSFLKEILMSPSLNSIGLAIFDGEPNESNLIARIPNEGSSGTDALNNGGAFSADNSETYKVSVDFDVAGRTWTINYFSLQAFDDQSIISWTPLIFLSGISFSFLLFGMIYWEASARFKLEEKALALVESENQKHILFENEQTARLLAEQANATKDEFLAVVSHELRTPLNAIGGWVKILGSESVSPVLKETALEKIDKNVRAQSKLVEELLNYSQMLAGKDGIAQSEIEIANVVENACDEIAPIAASKNIEFTKAIELNGQTLFGDERKLLIAFNHLLSNAVKFTETGGKIEVSAFEQRGYLEIVVSDNGRGITSEFLPHIFERFRQADASITRDAGGLGLGLTVTNQIVKLHNGSIKAESDGAGKGSTFIISLPCGKN